MIRILLALPLLLVSCATPQDAPRETIKIVSALPRTGSTYIATQEIVNGIRLALEEAQWRVGEYSLYFEDVDYFSATTGWKQIEPTARQIVNDPDVMVCIGTYNSGAAMIYMPILNRANLLMISPATTWAPLTKPVLGEAGEPGVYRPTGRINFVRVVPADDVQASVGAEWARKSGIKSVYVLDDRNFYGKGMADLFRARAEAIGLKVLGHEGIDTQAADFKPALAKVKALEPDLVYYGGATQTKAGQVAKDMVGAGLKAKLMVSDACFEDEFIASAGAANLEGRCYVTFGLLPTEKIEARCVEFVRRFRMRFGKTPEGYGVYGYEAARAALEAIRRAGKKDRDAIRAACLAIQDFNGVLGTWSFDENGDTTLRTMGIYTVREGKFEFVEMMN